LYYFDKTLLLGFRMDLMYVIVICCSFLFCSGLPGDRGANGPNGNPGLNGVDGEPGRIGNQSQIFFQS
jgi:hypothetical protein